MARGKYEDRVRHIEATVVEGATLPGTPEEPDPFGNGIVAGAFDLMVGIGVAFLMEVVEPRGKPRAKPE